MVNVALLRPGEPANSQRIIVECGAAVTSGLDYLVSHHLETGAELPACARPVWRAISTGSTRRRPRCGTSACTERAFSRRS